MAEVRPQPQPVLRQLGIVPSAVRRVRPATRRTHCQAIVNWLTRYRLPAEPSNFEQVKGFVEAFYHLCAMEEWERALTLISVRLNMPTQEMLYYQLKLWGYAQERTALY